MTVLSGRRIELWVEERDGAPAVNPVMQALLDDLATNGADIRVRVPECELIDLEPSPRPDLVLLKTATSLGLSLAMATERAGVRFLNGAGVTLRAHDKAAAIGHLARAGVPVPETYLVDGGAEVTPPVEPCGTWVSKPTRGVHGRGVQFHARFPSAPLAEMRLDPRGAYTVDDGTRLIQRQIGGAQADVKVYVVGEQCFAGTKPFSRVSYTSDEIEAVALDSTTTESVCTAGRVLGLRCFGVDLRCDADRPVVIDVNPFPGYRGFPAAVPALLAEIGRVLEARA
jgi:ribosomal protein S6--L-glutamate ligase